ncbi:trypsin-like peptidase domain-containing protein [Patescibacteria group bacterium]|nr:trypsin-like peptidase domain-containing protein [Patescibacteria group bacterium]
MRNFLIGLLVSVVVLFSAFGGALADRLFVIRPLDGILKRTDSGQARMTEEDDSGQARMTGGSSVVDVVERVSPAVVTVAMEGQTQGKIVFDTFNFAFRQEEPETIQQDIGSGFVVDGIEGIVVTNKHVVSRSGVRYIIIDKDGVEYEVEDLYIDPINDLAILKIKGEKELEAIVLGDSDSLKVGQGVVVIGTALGEFRHTVTTGVISGLGRGINAGDGSYGSLERIDNVIQTDAAINPGNSGGPLLNLNGEVIGVSVAVVGGAENIGFAIPINVVKESLSNFKETGSFDRVQLGVKYRMIDKDVALLNDVPAGAYVVEVMKDSLAEKNEILVGDIIVKLEDQRIADVDGGLAGLIGKLKVGETIEVELWRKGEILNKNIKL